MDCRCDLAEINLRRRFVRYLLRQDDIVLQSSGLNAPTHQSSGERPDHILDEFGAVYVCGGRGILRLEAAPDQGRG